MSVLYFKNANGEFVNVPYIEGKSAYEIAVERGKFSGTEEEFAQAQVITNKEIIDQITQENIDLWNEGGNIDLSEYAKVKDLNGLFDNVEVNEVETNDTQTALDFYSKGRVVKTVYFTGGGGGGTTTSAYISTELSENIMVSTGEDFELALFFNSPNPGKGTLKVFINNTDALTTPIIQGESITAVSGDLFSKGQNQVVVYVIDRFGVMSNSLTFYVRYGGLEVTSDFDVYSAYDYGSLVRYYFLPTAVDTSLALTFYMNIDGATQTGVSCTSDTRGYFTFPSNLSVGRHLCKAWVQDSNGTKSNELIFNLIILDNTSLIVASDTQSTTVEEGAQLSLDYKVYMKDNSVFNTYVYIDNVLVDTGTCGLATNYYKTSSLLEGLHTVKLEVYDVTNTVSDYLTWTVTVAPSTYEMITPTVAGALLIASAKNKSNTAGDKNEWIGKNQDNNDVSLELVDFSFNQENGWVNDQLLITGGSYVNVPIAPLADNAKYGFTLDIEFLTKPIGVEDALVLDLWDEVNNCGIKITTEELIMQSKDGNRCDLYFEEDTIVSAMFVIDRNEGTAKIYLDGVVCEAFRLTDYEVNGVKYLEDFTVTKNIKLGGKGYCAIRNLRVYQVALTTDESINNFIANKTIKSEQRDLVEFQKGNDLPTMIIYCDFSGLGKDDKKPCDIVYNSTDVTKYGESFNIDGMYSQLQYQGTSSMAYPIKNYRINPRDKNGKKKINPFNGGKPESRFTLKADFITSNHAHNTGMAKFISDKLYNYNDNDEKTMNPMRWYLLQNGEDVNSVRETINGFPIKLILVNNGSTQLNAGQAEPTPGNTKDMGIFNLNNDKDNLNTMGMDTKIFPNCISYEVTANSDTSAGAFVPFNGTDSAEELSYLQNSFELRYPDEDDVGKDYGYLNLKGDSTKSLKRVIDWVGNATKEEFLADFDKYFNKHYTLRYFLFVTLIGAIDNLGKNMMLDTWDGQIWYPRFYDIDTILSYDNSGEIKFDVDIEMEQGYWNTSGSRLWTKIRDYMHDELVEVYKDMRANGVTYENIMHYMYDEQIAKIPQKYYNMDFDIKYAPYADTYLGKAHGDGLQHMKRWLKKRFIFCDTLFDYAPSYENDVLTIRANTLNQMNLTIETYTPLYQHVSFYNGNMEKIKVKPGEPITFSGYAQTATDQEVLIYGGSNIKKITGISSCNPNSMLIGDAPRLTELDISNCPILTIVNSNKANFSPHTYLNKLNMSNCPQLGGNLNVSNSPLLQEIDARGSAITGLLLSTSLRNLEVLRLPRTLGSLTLHDVPLLHTIELDTDNTLQSISLTNCDKLNNLINFDLFNVSTLLLDNSCNAEELYIGSTNLTLKNMPTLKRVIFTPNSEYSEFDINNVINGASYKVTTFNNPKMTDFITTAPHRISYKNGEYGDITPNTVFTANTLDLSDTQFQNVKFLCTTDVYNLKVPTTMKNFYCDSAFDINTDVIEDASYEVIHNELIEPYTTNYEGKVLLKGETPNIIPSSANGSLIFNMYSNNTTAPTSTSPYMWDLTGLKLEDFHTFGMNNWVKRDVQGNITMPQRMSGYSVRMTNADITPNEYPTMLYPLLVDTTLPITGKLDYTKYTGTCLAWAFAYTTSDVTINPPDSRYYVNITNDYNKLYGTNYKDITDIWIYKELDTSTLINNPDITKVYLELTSSNYTTRIDQVLQYYPNCTDLYLFEDGSVTSLQNMLNTYNTTCKNQIEKVVFMDGYFTNLTNMEYTFKGCTSLKVAPRIPDTVVTLYETFRGCTALLTPPPSIPNSVTMMYGTFLQCGKLTTAPNIPNNVTNMEYTFRLCSSLTTAPTIGNKVTNMSACFRDCTSLVTAPNIPNSVTNMTSCFYGCTALTSVPNISSSCTIYDECFGDCTKLVTVPKDGWKGRMTSTFVNCKNLNCQLNLSQATTLLSTFYCCEKLTYTPTLPSSITNGDLSSIFQMCKSLTTTPTLPSGVVKLNAAFESCYKLVTPPVIPNTVTDMTACFESCIVMTSPANIPSSVTKIDYIYDDCRLLTTATISLNVTSYKYAIGRCPKLTNITWSGTRTSSFSLVDLGKSPVDNNHYVYKQADIQELVPEFLGTVSSATLTLDSTCLGYLTEEEVVNAMMKGWTLSSNTSVVKVGKNDTVSATNNNVTACIIELTSYNYKTRIDQVLAYYPNCVSAYFYDNNDMTSLAGLFYDAYDGNTVSGKQLKKIRFLEGYFNKVYDFTYAIAKTYSIETTNIPKNVTSMQYAFLRATKFKSIEGNIPSGVTSMLGTFYSAESFNQQLDLSKLNLTDSAGLRQTFLYCYALSYTPILPTSYKGIMSECFRSCVLLTVAPTLPSGVTGLDNCFRECTALTTPPSTIPNTVTSMVNTFYQCRKLTTPPAIPSKVTNLNGCFYYCDAMTKGATINTTVVGNISSMYYRCSKMTTCEIPLCANSCSNTLFGISASCDITWLGERTADLDVYNDNPGMSFSNARKVDIQELVPEHLATVSGKTLTLGSTYLGYLTQDEISQAVAKGWTLQ